MHESARPVRLAGTPLGALSPRLRLLPHADEEYRVLLPFVREGFERGEKAFHIVDPGTREHLGAWQRGGHRRRRRPSKRGSSSRGWEEAYLREGHFDQDAMLALIEEVLEGGQGAGLPADPAGGAHGVGAGGPARRRRPRRVRDAAELRPAEVRRPGRLNVRPRQVWRRTSSWTSCGPTRWSSSAGAAGEPLLRPARRVPARAARAPRAGRADEGMDVAVKGSGAGTWRQASLTKSAGFGGACGTSWCFTRPT